MVYYKENLTAKARVQNCVMFISVGGQANLNSGTYIPLPATDGRNTRFQHVTLQVVILRREENKILSLYHSTKGAAAVQGNRLLT